MRNLEDDELKALMEHAAELGAEKALEKLTNQVYQEVGKTVIKRLLQMFGGILVAAAIYAANQGWFK